MGNEKNEEEFIAGTDLRTGREKAEAAQKLRLHLMRKQGRDFQSAGSAALHELQHLTAIKPDKRLETGTGKTGRAFARPKDPLTMEEVYRMSTAVGEKNMSDTDRRNARWAKFFLFIEHLFKRK